MIFEIVKLPKDKPDSVRGYTDWSLGTDDYLVINQRPKLNEWYIDIFTAENARSIQKTTTKKRIILV